MNGDDLRISDADRDQAVTRLSEHFQAGRLSADEFDERSGAALQAKTGREVAALFTDLPPDQAPAARAATVARSRVWGLPVVPIVAAVIVLSVVSVTVGGHDTGIHVGFGGLIPLLIVFLVIRRFGGFGGNRDWRQ
jgi:uncharacterized protein DUF1707